jgi:hypothetical protein
MEAAAELDFQYQYPTVAGAGVDFSYILLEPVEAGVKRTSGSGLNILQKMGYESNFCTILNNGGRS